MARVTSRAAGSVNWGASRKLLSWGANTSRTWSSGCRRVTARRLPLLPPPGAGDDRPASIRANGYSYLIEMLYCSAAGFTVGETPIIFADRRFGKSKISRGRDLSRHAYGGSGWAAATERNESRDA